MISAVLFARGPASVLLWTGSTVTIALMIALGFGWINAGWGLIALMTSIVVTFASIYVGASRKDSLKGPEE